MGRGTSKAGGGSGSVSTKGIVGVQNYNPGGYTGEDRAFVLDLAKDYASGDLYGGDMQAAVESYAIGKNINDNDMIDAVRNQAAIMSFGGSSTLGASVNGKPFDPKDFKTWRVGDKVTYTIREGKPISYTGEIMAVKPTGSVLVTANGMRLVIDNDTKGFFKVKK